MKRNIIIIFYLLAASLYSYSSNPNLLLNGDFEIWDTEKNCPEGWCTNALKSSEFIRMQEEAYSSESYLMSPSEDKISRFNSTYFKVSTGRYMLTYYNRGESLLRWVVLTPKGESPARPAEDNNNIGATNYQSDGIKLNNPFWTKIECYFDIPEGIKDAEYCVTFSYESTQTPYHFSIDKVSLQTFPSNNEPWQSELVRQNEDGSINYFADNFGFFIPDFSSCGYRGGGIDLPNIEVIKTIKALGGDNTAHIQAAIDEVASKPLINGIRGTILLKAGLYNISGSIQVNQSGIVLRGEGQGDSPENSTILMATGNTPNQRTFINIGNENNPNKWSTKLSPDIKITDDYIPAGSNQVKVESIQYFSVGDMVVIKHPNTQNWLDAIDGGVGNSGANPWTLKDNLNIIYNRYITNINSNTNTITLDAPVYYGLDRSLSQSYIYKISPINIIKEVGLENLRIDCEFDTSAITSDPKLGDYLSDEAHAWNGIQLISAENAWIKDVTVVHFGGFGIYTTNTTRSTIKNCSVIDPISIITGSRRYGFNTSFNSQLILFENCYARKARHGFVSNGTSTASGIVFLYCKSDLAYAASEGHRRWSQGFLYDNLKEIAYNGTYKHTLALNNRGSYGTSHGWGLVTSVAWNCDLTAGDPTAGHLIVQRPPTGQNFAIGCKAQAVDGNGPFLEPEGYIEGRNWSNELQPKSLYEAQVKSKKTELSIETVQLLSSSTDKSFKIMVNDSNSITIEKKINIPFNSLVKIYSLKGQLITSIFYKDQEDIFKLNMLPKGVYIGIWKN